MSRYDRDFGWAEILAIGVSVTLVVAAFILALAIPICWHLSSQEHTRVKAVQACMKTANPTDCLDRLNFLRNSGSD